MQSSEKYFAPVNVLSCLEKFKAESGDGKGYTGLNPSCEDIQIQQFLKVGDTIVGSTGEDKVDFIATKTVLEFDKEKAIADMVSQEIKVPSLDNASGDAAYLSSVTSLVARLPAFDFVEHNKLAYLRIKSDQIVYAQHIGSESGSQNGTQSERIIILPTDDSRINLMIIPVSEISKTSNSSNLLQSVQSIMANL